MIRRHIVELLLAVVMGIAVSGTTSAVTLLSDFSNFALTGTYEVWNGATFTAGPDDFRVEAPGDFGGGWLELPAAIDASGETHLELQLDVNDPGNVATVMNVVLFDADGTERVYRFEGLTAGADQTLTIPISMFHQDNAPGTTPGLDLANITTFHLQGTFENGNPGLAMDLTFDNLALVIPEPATTSMAVIGVIGVLGLSRRRTGC